MASSYSENDKSAIAKNLIETCGLHRALHAARQFGWHDVAEKIAARIEASPASNTKN
ncbi:MAG: hypothetical protein ABJN40_12400 [Sneathiella sp.]